MAPGILTSEILVMIAENVSEGVCVVDRERRIQYWNRGAEAITGYSSLEMLHEHCHKTRISHVDDDGEALCKSRCPLHKSINSATPASADVHLMHKHGHRVPVRVRTVPARDAHNRVVGAIEFFSDLTLHESYQSRIEALEAKVHLDALTGLPNRGYLEQAITARLNEFRRFNWSFALAVFDLDLFKSFNDTWGHLVGDQVLRIVAKTLAFSARSFDVVGRWGGEEFVAILANTDGPGLTSAVKRFHSLVGATQIPVGKAILQVSLSAGATVVRVGDNSESMFQRADEYLYQSKRLGRNRLTVDGVCIEGSLPPLRGSSNQS